MTLCSADEICVSIKWPIEEKRVTSGLSLSFSLPLSALGLSVGEVEEGVDVEVRGSEDLGGVG